LLEIILELQVALNSFAREVFRDQGDKDYVSARLLYRLKFREQFLWSGLQAIEKYLKAILLFNKRTTRYPRWPDTRGKEFGHDLVALYQAVGNINEIQFTCPAKVEEIVTYLSHFGMNRYFDRSTYTIGDEFLKLDQAVWHIRRYCQYLHFVVEDRSGISRDIIAERAVKLNASSIVQSPWKFGLRDGYLEKILSRSQNDPARKALVWQNPFYGACGKGQIKFSPMMGSASPPNVRSWSQDPGLRFELQEYIKLPPLS
jgi:hypothetical protein